VEAVRTQRDDEESVEREILTRRCQINNNLSFLHRITPPRRRNHLLTRHGCSCMESKCMMQQPFGGVNDK
jgi:hypothetical protein